MNIRTCARIHASARAKVSVSGHAHLPNPAHAWAPTIAQQAHATCAQEVRHALCRWGRAARGARARSACLRRAAPACGSPHLGLGLGLHADLLDLQADEARDVLARARVEEHAARIGDAVILAAPRDDALVGRLNARETVAHGGRWCGEHEGRGGEEGEGGRRSRAQWQPRPQLHPPARRTSPPPRLRSPARAPAAPRSPLPHQDQFAGSALLLGRHAPAAAEGWSFRGLCACTAQPRRLLFRGSADSQ